MVSCEAGLYTTSPLRASTTTTPTFPRSPNPGNERTIGTRQTTCSPAITTSGVRAIKPMPSSDTTWRFTRRRASSALMFRVATTCTFSWIGAVCGTEPASRRIAVAIVSHLDLKNCEQVYHIGVKQDHRRFPRAVRLVGATGAPTRHYLQYRIDPPKGQPDRRPADCLPSKRAGV